jgi:hypothetical protein
MVFVSLMVMFGVFQEMACYANQLFIEFRDWLDNAGEMRPGNLSENFRGVL